MESILFIVAIIAFFYLAMIRPQQRREKQRQGLISGLEPGDEIVTIGGVMGIVSSVDDDSVAIEVADGIVIRIIKRAVSFKVEPPQPEAEETETAGGDGESADKAGES
ncbi:MAG: preprotein translocase subunit YajC [Acidimicrobiia bacterium]